MTLHLQIHGDGTSADTKIAVTEEDGRLVGYLAHVQHVRLNLEVRERPTITVRVIAPRGVPPIGQEP